MKISAFISSFLIILTSSLTLGQGRFVPSAIRIGTDLSNLGVAFFDDNRSYYEFHADIDFDKFFLSADLGFDENTDTNETYIYQYSGKYFRIGPEINILARDKMRSVFFFGLRYASANFDDAVLFSYEDPNLGVIQLNRQNSDVKASWGELVAGLKVRIWKQLYLGYTGRLKIALNTSGDSGLESYYVPGWGTTDENSQFGINYHIFYRFQFREKPIPPKRIPGN